MNAQTLSPYSLLAHFRHELYGSINIITGYSSLLIEELEELEEEEQKEQNSQEIIEQLNKISDYGYQIEELVKTILAPSSLDKDKSFLTLSLLSEKLDAAIEKPINIIISYCEKMLEIVDVELSPDLEKIKKSAQLLQVIVPDIAPRIFLNYIPSTRPTSK